MATALHKLTDRKIKAASKPSRISDGGGLYLRVRNANAKSWAFVYRRSGNWNEIGIGSYPAVSLAKARERAAEMRSALADGRDPKSVRDKEAEPTFGACADRFVKTMESQWDNPKHRAQWRMTLGDAYCLKIRGKLVSQIDTQDVLAVLSPIWTEKPETASRLRGRIERVLDYAKANGWRNTENPALWRGHLKNLLPGRKKLSRGHHPAMPYADVPGFVQRLRSSKAMAARALEFLILTAARSGEVLNMRWQEVDLENAIWTIPPERMKARTEHVVPLSDTAIAILKPLNETRVSEFVFPGQRSKRPLSSSTMEMLLRRLKADHFTTHGFRSSFRDWVGDCTTFPREVAEAALAHKVGDAVERAYRRSDALEKRRALMQAWADYCHGNAVSNVVAFERR